MKTGKNTETLTFLILGVIIILSLSSCSSNRTPSSAEPTEIVHHVPLTDSPSSQIGTEASESEEPTRSETSSATLEAGGTADVEHIPTSKPTASPFPTSDRTQPLSPEGPWVICQIDDDPEGWFIVNADGTGRMKIEYPTGNPQPVMIPSTSSNYLAYWIRESDPDVNVINIIRIPDMEIVEIIDCISYPGLLESIAYTDSHTGTWYALREDPVWSPDGRYLAFVGAIEGPSSDVYIYDTLDDEVRRLTSGEHHAVDLMWSPSSQWIVHHEVAVFGAGCNEIATWAVSANGEVALRLYEACFDPILGWLGPDQYMSYDYEIIGMWNLRYVDLHQGEVTTLYKKFFHLTSEPFDPIHGNVTFVPLCIDPQAEVCASGTYWISPTHPTPRRISSEALLFHWDSNLKHLVTRHLDCEEGYIAALQMDGSLECIQKSTFRGEVSWSPDGKWAIPLDYGNDLYSMRTKRYAGFPTMNPKR